MNSLPRFLGLALFVVLAALTALLVVPTWRAARTAETPATASQLAALPPRIALALALTGTVLAVVLVVSHAQRPSRSSDTKLPFAVARTEIDAIAKLAENSAVQGAELSRERDVRRRAEEDAHLRQQLLARSQEDKVRLGHDLHDGIIQSLYAVGLTLESVRAIVTTDPTEADRRLAQSLTALNATIRDVRSYITGLTPDALRRGGLAQGLASLLEESRAGRDVRFDVKIDDQAAARLSPEQVIDALQISREAVSHALRHGGASLITVRVHESGDEVCLLVQDNGTGFDATTVRDGGQGLANMRARTARLGASVRLSSQPGEGTRVVVTLPLHPPAAV
jgi:signal transduction histidine kinase